MSTRSERPTLWFDRPLMPELRDLVEGRAEVRYPEVGDERLAGIEGAHGVVAGAAIRYDRTIYERTPELRVVCRAGIGFDNLDLADATEFGIAACNAPEAPTISTAEQAVALIFAITKGLRESHLRLERQEGNYWPRHQHLELAGRTLGLVGLGRIGGRVAAIMRSVGMDVVAYDPYVGEERFAGLGVRRAATLVDLLGQCQVISVHAPLSAETHHLIDARAIDAMVDGVYLVNTARGGLVDDGALVAALDSGKVRAAGLDVTDPEPLPGGHPLLGRDDVVVTPHVASATTAGARRLFRMAIEIVLSTLEGNRPDSLLNPAVWPGRNA